MWIYIVFKCTLYYYLDMVRPVDRGMTAIEKIAYGSRFLGGGWCAMPCREGHPGKHQNRSGDRGRAGKMGASIFIVVPAGNARQGRVSTFRIG